MIFYITIIYLIKMTSYNIEQCSIPYAEAPPIFTAQQYDILNQKWDAIKYIIEKHDPKFVLETQQKIDIFRFKLLTGENIEIFQEIRITIDEITNSIKQIELNNRNKTLASPSESMFGQITI